MKKDIITYFFVVLLIGTAFLGRIRPEDPVKAGDILSIHVNVKNPFDNDYDDVSVRAVFFELGEYVVTPEFRLDDYDTEGFWLDLYIPKNTEKGEQIVKIIVSNDEIHDSKYLPITIV
jgi:hypothetical protein